jgi:hypothetical protein
VDRLQAIVPTLVGISALITGGLVFGLSQLQALVILFIVLPVAVAAVIVPLMVRRLSKGPRPILTSELLASGTPAEGKILNIRSLGNILDVRPMIRFDVEATVEADEEPFELQVFQAFPRSMVGVFKPGDIVRLRLSPDRTTGAIEWGYEATDG